MRLRRQGTPDGLATAVVPTRGIGPTAWTSDKRERIQVRRRFMLLGQTLDGMRVWDIRRAIQALQSFSDASIPITIEAEGVMAGNALFASLFEKGVAGLVLDGLHSSHRHGGPIYLNVRRFLDVPAAAAMAAERCVVDLKNANPREWRFTSGVVEQLGWDGRLKFSNPEK